MRNIKIYIIGLLCLFVGFVAAWLILKSKYQLIAESDNHSIIDSKTSKNQASKNKVFTCSMHPQIRQNEPGDCPLCGMDLIPASQASSDNEIGFQMTADAIQLANIQTTIIGNTDSTEGSTLKLNGKIQADETKSASLVTHIPGRIEKLYVSYTGEQVNKGQKIATIYSPELITAQKELLEAQKIQDISPGLLTAAKNKLKYWKIGEQVIQDILTSGTIRETFNLYADHTGVVNQKRVSVGDYLSTGEVLFDVQNLYSLWALFDVYENDLSQVKIGRTIYFTTPSAPNKRFKAKITFVNPVIDPNTRAATIRAEVSNTTGKLKPEMFVSGELQTSKKSDNLTVPKSAVLWTGQRSVVYVKIPETDIPSFEYREIEIADATASGYVIVRGLEYGEEVVTNGAFVIDASSQLNNQVSMMNKNVSIKSQSTTSETPRLQEAPLWFKKALTNFYYNYLDIKAALVQSDPSATQTSSKVFLDNLSMISELDSTTQSSITHAMNSLKLQSTKMAISSDIDSQRSIFYSMTQELIELIESFGLIGETVYVQHCPMAFDNTGADWISDATEIKNPYFGNKMLKCGAITKEMVFDPN